MMIPDTIEILQGEVHQDGVLIPWAVAAVIAQQLTRYDELESLVGAGRLEEASEAVRAAREGGEVQRQLERRPSARTIADQWAEVGAIWVSAYALGGLDDGTLPLTADEIDLAQAEDLKARARLLPTIDPRDARRAYEDFFLCADQ